MAKRKTKAKAGKKKATKAKAKAKGKKGGRETLVVASKVKNYVRGKGYIASGDLIASLNDAVHHLLDHATERTTANRRSTVRPQDI
jgi:hypothetical protein